MSSSSLRSILPHAPKAASRWLAGLLVSLAVACGGEAPEHHATASSDGGSSSSSGGAITLPTLDPPTSTATTSSADGTSSGGEETTEGASSSGEIEPAAPLTLLSLNLHCLRLDGTVFSTNAERFDAIAALVAERAVDVMTLQEACVRPGEDAIEMLRVAIERHTGQTWSSTWALAHVAWEGTPEEADEGVGLLVRGALEDPGVLEHAVQGPLRRIAVSATLPPQLSAPLGGLRVTSVHFEVLEPGARAMQARETAVAALVDTDDAFLAVVAGDFNDVEGSPTQAAFPAMGYVAADAGLDPTGIDHVMIHRAAPLRPVSAEEVFLGVDAVSDHPGILVRFEPAQGDPVTITRITAQVDPSLDGFVSVRGDAAPLSWRLGFPMRRMAAGEHALVTTELRTAFEYKVLLDDASWQTGPNVPGMPGTDHVVMPVF